MEASTPDPASVAGLLPPSPELPPVPEPPAPLPPVAVLPPELLPVFTLPPLPGLPPAPVLPPVEMRPPVPELPPVPGLPEDDEHASKADMVVKEIAANTIKPVRDIEWRPFRSCRDLHR